MCEYYYLNAIFHAVQHFPELPCYLSAVLIVEDSQNENVDKRDEKGRMCVEFLFLHKDVCPVTEVEVQHDEAHFEHGQ